MSGCCEIRSMLRCRIVNDHESMIFQQDVWAVQLLDLLIYPNRMQIANVAFQNGWLLSTELSVGERMHCCWEHTWVSLLLIGHLQA